MIKVFNQFRRIYEDDGHNDRDFAEQEVKLKAAQHRVVTAAARLMRASEVLNDAALRAFPVSGEERH